MILATKLFVFVTPHSRIFHSHIDVTKSDTNCKSYVTSTSQRRTLVKEQSPSMLNALRLGAGIKKKNLPVVRRAFKNCAIATTFK